VYDEKQETEESDLSLSIVFCGVTNKIFCSVFLLCEETGQYRSKVQVYFFNERTGFNEMCINIAQLEDVPPSPFLLSIVQTCYF
jgi:hypothetical protein